MAHETLRQETEFCKQFGPMSISTGYGRDIQDYAIRQSDKLQVWNAAIKWASDNPEPQDPSPVQRQTELSVLLDEIEERAKTRLTEIEKIAFLNSDVLALVKALRRSVQLIHVSNHEKAGAELTAILTQAK